VCGECAIALGQVEGRHSQYCHFWWAQGAKLAALLADGSPSLELYNVLPAKELAKIVAEISVCASRAVEIRGSLDVQ